MINIPIEISSILVLRKSAGKGVKSRKRIRRYCTYIDSGTIMQEVAESFRTKGHTKMASIIDGTANLHLLGGLLDDL